MRKIICSLIIGAVLLQGCATIVATATGPAAGVSCPAKAIASEAALVKKIVVVLAAPLIAAGGVVFGFINGATQDATNVVNGKITDLAEATVVARCGDIR